MQLRYVGRLGKTAGAVLTPHRYGDGTYVAAPNRYAISQRRFPSEEECVRFAQSNGWCVRMSVQGQTAPSLIRVDRCELD